MLHTVVQLALQLQHDEQGDSKTLRHRDRAIGKTLSDLKTHPVRQLTAWLHHVSTEEDQTRARYATRAQHMVVVLLVVLGMATGMGAAAAAFYYDGQHPINVLPILAVFVLLPLMMLLPWIVTAAPSTWSHALPLLSSLSEALAMILAVIMSAVTRALPQPYREALLEAAGRREAYRRVYGRMQKWMLLSWSQTFTFAFILGALLWFGYRLVVTDLAFTWSTTLQTQQPETLYAWIYRLTHALALPWSAFLPQAEPTAELIRDTHYFRLNEGVLTDSAQPGTLGGWWPFLMMSMVCYGLLPRLVTLAVCAWRYRLASRWCLVHTPGAADVLDRLNSAMIETESPTAEATLEPQAEAEARVAEPDVGAVSRVVMINWSAVPVTDEDARQLLAQTFELDVLLQFQAGGLKTLDEDADVIAQVAKALRDRPSEAQLNANQLVVLVKAWEPPVMDLLDFLGDVRQALDDGLRIRVVPLWMPHGKLENRADAAVYIEQWRQKLATLGDPWLSVRAPRLDASGGKAHPDAIAAHSHREPADE